MAPELLQSSGKGAGRADASRAGVDEGPPHYHLGTPLRPRDDDSGRGPEVHKVSLDKRDLGKLSDEHKFRTWSKSVEMAMDEIWVGLEDVLKMVKSRSAPMSPAELERELEATGMRPPASPYHEGTYRFIGRYLYGVLL